MKKRAFTLIELIVAITILSILGTIAFISLQGYSQTSRNSVRITDMKNIKLGLEFFYINSGKYPLTTGGYDITYGGGNVWNQGTFGKTTFQNVGNLSTLPLDPLTGVEYTYSLLNTKQEYELAGIMEGDSLSNNIGNMQTYAADQTLTAIVTGNYNGETANVNVSGTGCIIAVPSIITSTGTTLENIVSNDYLVYNKYKNLPSNYNTLTKFRLLGENSLKLVNSSNMELYCGSYNDIQINETIRLDFIENYQKAYSGTLVEQTGIIRQVLELSIDKVNPSPDLKLFTIELVEEKFDVLISEEQKLAAASCNSGYHDEGTGCISNTRNATVINGTGTETWNGSSWDATVVTSCNSGYSLVGGSCTQNVWVSGSWGNCSANPTWSAWSTCSGMSQSRTCSNTSGTQTRSVVCQSTGGATLNDGDCLLSKPSTSSSCTESCIGSSTQSCCHEQTGQSCTVNGSCEGRLGEYVLQAGCTYASPTYTAGNGDGWNLAFSYGGATGRNCTVSDARIVRPTYYAASYPPCNIAEYYQRYDYVRVYSSPINGTRQCDGSCQ